MGLKVGVGGVMKDVTAAYLGVVEPCYLSFDGVDDKLTGRNSTDLDWAMPIKFRFKTGIVGTQEVLTWKVLGNYYWFANIRSSAQFDITVKSPTNGTIGFVTTTILSSNTEYLVELDHDGSNYVYKLNGVVEVTDMRPYEAFTNGGIVAIGARNNGSVPFDGDLYMVQVGDDIFDFTECSGATVTSSEGTVLDIDGATWHGGSYFKEITNIYLGDGGTFKTIL